MKTRLKDDRRCISERLSHRHERVLNMHIAITFSIVATQATPEAPALQEIVVVQEARVQPYHSLEWL